MRSPHTTTKSSPCSMQLEKAHMQQQRPTATPNKELKTECGSSSGKLKKNHWTVLILWWKVKVPQSCPILCDPMGYTVHGILQARILKWVYVPFSRGSSQPRDRIQVSHIAGGFFTKWATREDQACNNFVITRIKKSKERKLAKMAE